MHRRIIAHATTIACALMACTSLAAAQPARRESIKKTSPEVQGFSVVLVLGDFDAAGTGADNVPPAARKALADMKDFLPYKSYRLLDSVWILSGATTNTSSRLRGPDVSLPGAPGAGVAREYELVLSASPEPAGGTTNGRLRVSFQLRDPSVSTQVFTRRETAAAPRETSPTPSLDYMRAELNRRADAANLEARVAKARIEIEQLRSQFERRRTAQSESKSGPQDQSRLREEERQADEARKQIMERQTALDRMVRESVAARTHGVAVVPRTVIDTGFSMNTGETVVVGTSRVQGDKAIIVLLTAVPRGAQR